MTKLSYETALRLKEAGFPQHESGLRELGCNEDTCYADACIFTLSELIAACGKLSKKSVVLNVDHEAGYAHAHTDTTHGGSGTTPDEAVAELFIALNHDRTGNTRG